MSRSTPARESKANGGPSSGVVEWTLLLLSAVAWGLCFRPQPDPVLPWLALAPLLAWILRPAHGFASSTLGGWIHGTVSWWIAVAWMYPTLHDQGGLAAPLSLSLLLLLSLYLGSYHAVFVAAGRWLVAGEERGAAWLSLPALWVLLEWIRAMAVTGFPWNLAAYSFVKVPGALPLTAWIGSYGLSAAVVVTNLGVAAALLRRSARPLVAPLATAVACAAAAWLAASVDPRVSTAEEAGSHPVRIVQPNIAMLREPTPETLRENYRRLLQLSREACANLRADGLIVWPESATWPWDYSRNAFVREDVDSLHRQGCEVLLNSARTSDRGVHNSAWLVDRGATATYDKVHLVPFGEYVPAQRFLPFVKELARIESGFVPGESVTLIDWRGLQLGVAICFEVIFPIEVARRSQLGADVLVTVTNDAWYGDTWAPHQHLLASRFRAAENRLPLLRAAITGVSAVVDARGRVLDLIDVGEVGTLSAYLSSEQASPSPFARTRWLLPILVVACSAFAIASRLSRRKRLGHAR